MDDGRSFPSHPAKQSRSTALATVAILAVAADMSLTFALGFNPILPRSFFAWGLRRSVSVLERYQVSYFRLQSWCVFLAYDGGSHMATSHPTTCNIFQTATRPFDSESLGHLAVISTVLATSHARIKMIEAYFDAEGNVIHAEFTLGNLLCCTTYVFQPSYEQLPTTLPGEIWYSVINGDWYTMEEDWP